MNEQLLKTLGAEVLPSRKKLRKTSEGVASEFDSLIVKAFRCFEDFFQPLPTVRLTKGSSIVLDLEQL